MAGGINQYGYAGGDPVNHSDPFGLAVVLRGAAAQKFWTQLQRQARAMERSKDARRSEAGRELLGLMQTLMDSDDTLYIGVERGKMGFGWMNSGSGLGIRINPDAAKNQAPTVLLAHELGHAYAIMIDKNAGYFHNVSRSLEFENHARQFYQCTRRVFPLDFFGPPSCAP